MSGVPAWLDEYMPPRGPCGICGGPDARHRTVDAIHSRCRAGESPESLAEDYNLPLIVIARILSEKP